MLADRKRGNSDVKARRDYVEVFHATAVLISFLALVAGCTSNQGISSRQGSPAFKVSLAAPTRVSIQVIENITLVYATIHRTQGALLIVDTGAALTIITPSMLQRLGLSLSERAPRRQVQVMGGQTIEVPLVKMSAVQLGDAMVENLEVGVYEVAPRVPAIEGVLGGDFLHKFRITLDKNAGQMRLEPLNPR